MPRLGRRTFSTLSVRAGPVTMLVAFVASATGLFAAHPTLSVASRIGQAAPPRPLVIFRQRREGIPPPSGAPSRIDMTIYVDGRVVLAIRDPHRPVPPFRLSERRLRALREELAAARFSTLAPVYERDKAPNGSYLGSSITHAGRTVRLVRGARGPARLRPVVAFLTAIVFAHNGYGPGPG
jgi:hypothetical protein